MNSSLNESSYVVGVDGCKYGWIAIAIDEEENFELSKHLNFESIFKNYPEAKKYLVDMIVGLASHSAERNIEKLARGKLKPNRTSSVFTPPCREAVYEKNYANAKLKNIAITDKSISIQAWNIVPKIIEVDQFLIKNKDFQKKVFETHPEVCFAGLNNEVPMLEKKSKSEGIKERMNLLQKLFSKSNSIFKNGRQLFLKKEVKDDDLVDAMVLAVTGFLGEKNGYEFLSDNPIKKDKQGLEMKMIYCQNKKSLKIF